MVMDGAGIVAPLSWAGASTEPLMRAAAEAPDGVAVEIKAGVRHRSDGRAHGKGLMEAGHRPGPPRATTAGGRSLEDSAGGANYTMSSSHQQMVQELLQLAQQPQSTSAIRHLQWLLENAPSTSFLNTTDQDGRSALHYAMLHGNEAIMQVLAAAAGIDYNIIDSAGCTPLALAVATGHDRLVTKLLFASSANTQALARLDATLHGASRPEASPIALALGQPTVDCLKALLHTVKLQDRLQDGMGHAQRLSPKVLQNRKVQSQAPTEVQPELGRYSVRSSYQAGVGMGGGHGGGWSHAAGTCSLAALLRQPCDHHGRPALMVALRAKRLQHAYLLVSYGARLSVCEPESSGSTSVLAGSTPLHILTRHIARLEGNSPGIQRHPAQQHPGPASGAGPQSRSGPHSRSQSPTTMSSPGTPSSQLPTSSGAFSSQTPVAQAYSLFGLMLNQPTAAQACYQQDIEGNTALHVAAAAGLVMLVDQLLRAANAKFALLHMQNRQGFTALDVAAAAQQQAVVQLLTDCMPRHATAYTTGHARHLAAISGSDHASSMTSGQHSTYSIESSQPGSSHHSPCPSPTQPHSQPQPYASKSTPGTHAPHTSLHAPRQYGSSDGRHSHMHSHSTGLQEGTKPHKVRSPQQQHSEITPAPAPSTSRPQTHAVPQAQRQQQPTTTAPAAVLSPPQKQKETKSGSSFAKAIKKLFS